MPARRQPPIPRRAATTLLVTAGALALTAGPLAAAGHAGRADDQTTALISKAVGGGVPNGPSTNAVISTDRRYARIIAFQSDATDLVAGSADANGETDVFAVLRRTPFGNTGTPWIAAPVPGGGTAKLVSRTSSGKSANGRSFSPAVSGDFINPDPGGGGAPKGGTDGCVAFLSTATNLAGGDSNGKVDVYVAKAPGFDPVRASLDTSGKQLSTDVDGIAVSGGCDAVAFTAGGRLYVRKLAAKKTVEIDTKGKAADPSFAIGKGPAGPARISAVARDTTVVFGDAGGAYASYELGKPKLLAPGGSDPVMSDIETGDGRETVFAFVKAGKNGKDQIYFREKEPKQRSLGGNELASGRRGTEGNADSRLPTIGNAGQAITFETDATNLGTNANGLQGELRAGAAGRQRPQRPNPPPVDEGDDSDGDGDFGGGEGDEEEDFGPEDGGPNGKPDVYLYTNVRKITLVQSVKQKAVPLPAGGTNPAQSYYYNYIVFDSDAPLGAVDGVRQVFMRYLGAV
jgi:hypothetical protein